MAWSSDLVELLSGRKWSTQAFTYRFPSSASEYLPEYRRTTELSGTLTSFSAAQQEMALAAMQSWANVAPISFAPTAVSGEGNFRFMLSAGMTGSGALAWAYYPGQARAGDVWLNSEYSGLFSNTAPGSDALHTLIHEIGHGLGLKHPFDAPISGGGTAVPSGDERATTKYTVMAYDDYPGSFASGGAASFLPTTPMLLDIAATQYLYGANTSFHAGDDTYVFTQGQSYYQTIWDAGGTDTFQWNGSGSSEIDLRAGEFSELGNPITFNNGHAAQLDTVAIAFDVTIENAIGGSGSDTIWGNAAANYIDGGAGNDVIEGGIGDDHFRVGSRRGLDTITDAGGALDMLGVVATPSTVVLKRGGDDLYVLSSGTRDGAYLPSYFTLADRQFEQITFVGADDWIGIVWNQSEINAHVVANVLSVVNAPATKNSEINQWQKLSDFITLTDADGDSMVSFQVRDDNPAAGSSYLYAGGPRQQGETVTVNATTLSDADIWVRGGTGVGQEVIEVRASDGYDWGNWTSFTLNTRPPNRMPVPTPTAATQAVVIGQSVAAGTLFSVSDPDGDTITQYGFYDEGTGGGQFRVNGVALAPNTGANVVSAADLANTVYVGGASSGTEQLWVRAHDGTAWSVWAPWQEQSFVPADGAGNDFASGRIVSLSATPQTFSDSIGGGDNADSYTFTLNSDDMFRMQYAGTDPSATVRLSIHNNVNGTDGGIASGTPGNFDVVGTAPLDFTVNPLVMGTYSVQLVPLNGTNTNYNLTLTGS